METLCTTEYCPVMAEAAVGVPEYSPNRFMMIDGNPEPGKHRSTIRPIGIANNVNSSIYTVTQLSYHKFWVIANKKNFRSAKSSSDLADPDNIVGIGCFLCEKQDSKYYVFNINNVLFYGPVIFPDGGAYVDLYEMKVLHQDIMPNQDYEILKNYLSNVHHVEYWDFNKHA